eukprot:9496121-Pyramimonas_sp.AAC.1
MVDSATGGAAVPADARADPGGGEAQGRGGGHRDRQRGGGEELRDGGGGVHQGQGAVQAGGQDRVHVQRGAAVRRRPRPGGGVKIVLRTRTTVCMPCIAYMYH